MVQLFRDCQRSIQRPGGLAEIHLVVWMTIDLLKTAPKEHWDNFGKDYSVMSNTRRQAVALIGCVAIVLVAFALLSYGRSHEVVPILVFGHALDALIWAGMVGNLIVFLLAKLTRANPTRTALITFAVVNGLSVLLVSIIGSRVEPGFRLQPTLIGYVISFLFWYGLHWAWNKSQQSLPAGSEMN